MTPSDLKYITLKLASADEIRNVSGGEVTLDATFNDAGAPVQGGLFCRDIFGADGSGFGHIELACPVVHPWYESVVRVLIGSEDTSDGETVLQALRSLDFEGRCAELVSEWQSSGDEERPSFELKCIAAMNQSKAAAENLVLQAVPVVPPSVRPLVRTPKGATLTSDLNEHYQRLISRNNALGDLMSTMNEAKSSEILKDARERLASAVRALIGGPGADSPLQSLTDLLVARNGFLKRNLQGKRLDYSGRSVIVSGPDLSLRQCGMPYELAIEQFKPFAARKLVESGAARDSQDALNLISSEPKSKKVREAVEQVASEKLVLLNRAPTLHRLNIQPFEPVIHDHRAISLHPLVCQAFNADFDGDQMAIHVPISEAAQSEARRLLDSAVNLASPANGKPITHPVQDMTMGLWYVTADPADMEPVCCESAEKLLTDLEAGNVHVHQPVDLADKEFSGEASVRTTAGRVLFNANLPQEIRFVNSQQSKWNIQDLVGACLEKCGPARTRELLDDLDVLGFQYATIYAPSYGLGGLAGQDAVDQIRTAANEREGELYAKMRNGELDRDAYLGEINALWDKAGRDALEAVKSEMAKQGRGLHPIYAMPASGARGSWTSLAVSMGIGGPQARVPKDPADVSVFEAPSTGNYWNGLSGLEHFERTFGARKGLGDTCLKAGAAGNMMKNLIYAAQDVHVVSEDCGTADSLEVAPLEFDGKTLAGLAERIRGRVAAEDLKDESGEVIVHSGELISDAQAQRVQEAGISKAKIRSVLTCAQKNGVCAKCYGRDLAYGRMVEVGSAVGVVAAQAIAEPTLQLTFRTFVFVTWTTVKPEAAQHPGGLQDLGRVFAADFPEPTAAQIIERGQAIFRWQGVQVDDKHFEIVARKMCDFVRVDDPGDTALLKGDIVRREAFEAANHAAAKSGSKQAEGSSAVLGVRDAACTSPSVIGSAAVGATRRTIALAALAEASDELPGTLERIVAGLAPR